MKHLTLCGRTMNVFYFIYIWLMIIKFGQNEVNDNNIDTYPRLPDTIIPKHYFLTIESDLEEDKFVQKSSVVIHILCNKTTSQITLHSRNLQIKSINIIDIGQNELRIIDYKLEEKYDFLHIYLNEYLEENADYKVRIAFFAEITNCTLGYYRSSYKDSSEQTHWLATTHFEPTNARAAFPCFDEPALRARFTIQLGYRSHFESISNMPQKIIRKGKLGWVWKTFDTSLNMSTYLVAFAITDFKYKETIKSNQYGDTVIQIWTKKSSLTQVNFALDISPKFLSFFEEYFDIAYPLSKLDLIAVLDIPAEAMENWGLITFKERNLLFDPGTSTECEKYDIVNAIAHETAHNWFGNLVTIKWWSYLWLKEGITTYLARVAIENVIPEIISDYDEIILDNMQYVYAVDALETSRPISISINQSDGIHEIYNSINYYKGSCIIRMIELFLGNNTLKKGLKNYLNTYMYSSAEPDDLWSLLTAVAHEDIFLPENISMNIIMDTWTLQAGYPLVTVIRDRTNGIATVTQQRFLENVNTLDDSCYWIPLSYTTENERDFKSTKPKRWMPCPKQNIAIEFAKSDSTSWILFNIQASALYRVNYDETNWNMLIDQLERDYTKIETVNRVLLIDDVMQLAMTGHVHFQIAFNLISYIRLDNQEVTWQKALQQLFMIGQMMKRTPKYGYLKSYINNLVTPIYNEFGGLNWLQNFTAVQVLIIETVCSTCNRNCERDATAMFAKWVTRAKYTIPKPLRQIVYCQGVRNGNETEWNYVLHKYNTSKVESEKNIYLYALGCSRKQWLLLRCLEMIIQKDSTINNQHVVSTFKCIIENKAGYYIARTFFYEHIEEFYEIQSPKGSEMKYYLPMIVDTLKTSREYREFKTFLKAKKNYFIMAQSTLRIIFERLVVWKHWYQHLYPNIVVALKNEKQKSQKHFPTHKMKHK